MTHSRGPRRPVAVVVLAALALVSLAHLSRLMAPPDPPPGQALAATFLPFAEQTIPLDAGYLYVQPGDFGTDTGDGPRLRYALYPRRYDDIRAAEDEATVHALVRQEDLGYIVVPDASAYPPDHWLRQGRDWLRRIDLDAQRYVLVVTG